MKNVFNLGRRRGDERHVPKIDPIIERTFGWLRSLGFTASKDRDMSVGAAFVSDAVAVRPSYHWHDEYAYVTIARHSTPEPGPYWTQVHLEELLDHAGRPGGYDGSVQDQRLLEDVFARAASLLRDVALDQLAGHNLELLDEIIAKRPRRGVPGLDFPVTEPWAASQEGLWSTTDFSCPPPRIPETVHASRSGDARTRATSALRLHPGLAKGRAERASAFGRLVELLEDPDLDVRRAAASTLSEWRDLSVLAQILDLLDQEGGNAVSPFAAAATFLAIWQPPEVRQRVRDALDRFANRGDPAREQVAELRWRLDDQPPQYPRVSQVWTPGPK